ncbi:EF-hand [Aulographum hederae CBS 113979]|uniref:EF-hand n=1 Tax=Aulographum hederae CBS 113979 TaxID=1176131 RepID=A0A6G1GJH8_9PEZI|nr:EF-hand [Aulographum hederae CBS 113979]
MAYNKGYNPDALPAHAEPEQAAQMLGSGSSPSSSQQTVPGASRPHANSRPEQSSYYNKPPPPAPQNLRPGDDSYHRNSYGSGSSSRPSPTPVNAGDRPRYEERESDSGGYGSPPPQNYGFGSLDARPSGHSRPPVQRPPATPAPGRGDEGNRERDREREALWPIFRAVDKDGTNQLSESELRAALVNGDWTPFDPHTVKMMIRMFDTDRSGTISFDEFCGLWSFLSAWRTLFDRFDADRSGNISLSEFSSALVAFGYRLSPSFVSLLFSTYDRRGERAIGFDLFVQACISLKRMTDVFKRYDEDRDGYITLSFEEFLTGAQQLFLFNSISSVTDTGLY